MPGDGFGQTLMTLGFNPQTERYVGTWVGSMMAHLWVYDGWLDEAARAWGTDEEPVNPPEGGPTVAVAIWRDPWMAVGPRTYTTDLLTRLGWTNALAGPDADPSDHYPHVDLAVLDRPDVDLVLLPDEPYVFTAEDGPEAFTHAPTRLVSGRLLTWYGPAMVEAHEALAT